MATVLEKMRQELFTTTPDFVEEVLDDMGIHINRRDWHGKAINTAPQLYINCFDTKERESVPVLLLTPAQVREFKKLPNNTVVYKDDRGFILKEDVQVLKVEVKSKLRRAFENLMSLD